MGVMLRGSDGVRVHRTIGKVSGIGLKLIRI